LLVASGLLAGAGAVQAQDDADADAFLRAQSLIEALAHRGLLPRARADAMVQEARVRAGFGDAPAAKRASAPLASVGSLSNETLRANMRRELKAEVRGEVRAELRGEVRNEVRDEVLASADALLRQSRAVPGKVAAAPSALAAVAATAGTGPGTGAGPGAGPAVKSGAVAAQSAPAALASATVPATATATAAPPPSAAVLAAAAAGPGAPGTVKVTYVPQVVRDSIRNEVKEEVIAQMRAEAWGNGTPSAAAPEWTDRIKIEGDVRMRGQVDKLSPSNPTPEQFLLASLGGTTRSADLAAGTAAGLPTANTQDDRNRLRLRARLAINAKVNDQTSVGLRLATGAANDRVSTNQTLGQDFNRYSFLLDRAFIRYQPIEGGSLTLGRMANPWFSTDLQWSENLNFEGISASWQRKAVGSSTFEPFATAGWFPIRESAPPRGGRSLAGVQAGFQWQPSSANRFKFGLAQYSYSQIEGRVDQDYDAVLGAGRTYGQYEYAAGLRQKGNTLFLTNNPLEVATGLTPDKFRWGLASKFRPLAITVAAELSAFAPTLVMLSAEAVKNTAFNRKEIETRTGIKLGDGSDTGLTLKAVVGASEVRFRGDWQASFSYRRIGSDAVLDAFTDSDLGLGGTNQNGYSIGLLWGLDRSTSLGVRYLSSRSLDSMTLRTTVNDKYAVDNWQVDFNVRF